VLGSSEPTDTRSTSPDISPGGMLLGPGSIIHAQSKQSRSSRSIVLGPLGPTAPPGKPHSCGHPTASRVGTHPRPVGAHGVNRITPGRFLPARYFRLRRVGPLGPRPDALDCTASPSRGTGSAKDRQIYPVEYRCPVYPRPATARRGVLFFGSMAHGEDPPTAIKALGPVLQRVVARRGPRHRLRYPDSESGHRRRRVRLVGAHGTATLPGLLEAGPMTCDVTARWGLRHRVSLLVLTAGNHPAAQPAPWGATGRKPITRRLNRYTGIMRLT